MVKVTGWNNRVTTYTYDENNRVTGVTKPDGSETETTYDAAGRVVRTEDFFRIDDDTTTTISGFEYVYDKLGRITSETDLAKNVKLCYTYDTLSRVIKRETIRPANSTEVGTTETFTYDDAGNLTDTGFTYDTNNRLTMYNNVAVYYDPDGNMVSSSLGEGFFDSSNRLTSFNTTSYDYDVENIRVRKTYGEAVTTYTHNANSKLSQLLMKTENGVTTYYIYGLGLIYETTETDCKVYHYDYRGSTVALTNLQGSVTDTFTYDTYGKLTTRTGTSSTQFLYNGRDGVMSDENGLVYMRARYYSPTFKRFINADVVAGSITNAITLNRYAYANGNPVSNVDPWGLSPDERMLLWERNEIDEDVIVIPYNYSSNTEISSEIVLQESSSWLPKWLIGTFEIAGGVGEMLAGAALGATTGWTGVGLAASGVLIVDGAANITQGIGLIVNDVSNKTVLSESNIAKQAVQETGKLAFGEKGYQVAGYAYDAAVLTAGIYAGKVALQRAGKLPIKVKTSDLVPDPNNPMTDEGINYWTKTLSQNNFKGYNTLPNAYGNIEPISVQKDMIIANGHHRVEVLAKYGIETIKVYLTK